MAEPIINLDKKNNIYDILQKRYPANEYVIMAEVSDKAGFGRSNSADYIVVGLWPSRGLPVIGIELKSFRGDWLKELKNPAKAENIYQYCDYFYLLTADESIAKIEEIPASWGWVSIKGDRLKTIKEAPYLTAKALSKDFAVCMLRRAADKSKWIQIASIQDKIDEVKEQARLDYEKEYDRGKIRLKELEKERVDFEEAAGIRFGHWKQSPKDIGRAVKFLEDGGIPGIIKELERYKNGAEEIAKRIAGILSHNEIPEKVME